MQTIEKGLQFLRQNQSADGTFSIKAGPGLTALAITAAIRCGEPLDSPMVRKGLAALEAFVKPDGGIYGMGRLTNYETCIAILCFVEANASGNYNKILQDAKKFVTGIQYGSAAESTRADDVWNGGVGYGGKGRPDLSNTAYLIEALRAVDAGPDDPAIQAALAFVSRCQNLEGEHNKTEFAAKINDGGFYYELPKDRIDTSKNEESYTPDGGIRSYGSMSYAGYKSMVYAGLNASDPRVAAATKWIRKNYTVNDNPGKGQAGVYYY
ncbi:MAG TPA: prenyltransferase/squalene oxidase repeat-containing protein, partial [Pirellula sp.]|nr:prenyltransferase/squalene oxidase repeat-containing protein [Pirellula sp.]